MSPVPARNSVVSTFPSARNWFESWVNVADCAVVRMSASVRITEPVSVVVFVAVRTNQHAPEWLERFYEVVSQIPEIIEFHRLSGQIDYLLKIVVPDIESYDDVYKQLISNLSIFDVSSMFSMEEIKVTSAMPLAYAGKPRRS